MLRRALITIALAAGLATIVAGELSTRKSITWELFEGTHAQVFVDIVDRHLMFFIQNHDGNVSDIQWTKWKQSSRLSLGLWKPSTDPTYADHLNDMFYEKQAATFRVIRANGTMVLDFHERRSKSIFDAFWVEHDTATRLAFYSHPCVDSTSIGLPMWMLMTMSFAFPFLVLTVRPYYRYRRRKHGLCTRCGYDLRGTPSGRCPECGKEVVSHGR